MANILLTNKCIRECPYCFASKEMAHSPENDYLSWENAIYLADFLRASGERRVSLLGGEPTLHPEFVDILLYFIERGFGVTVFTSGVMSKARLGELEKHVSGIPAGRINFVCNLNNPEQTRTPKSESEKLHAFLSVLGSRTMPGFNIYRSDFEIEFLFDLVERYGLKKRLRLGIAHPIPGAENETIRVEDIGKVIEGLYSYKNAFDTLRIMPSFDCGFPLCRVTNEQLGWLTRLTGHVSFKCNPAIDITPDMSVYCCFPLSFLNRKSIFEFDSFRQVTGFYKKMLEQIRSKNPGIYEECANCVSRTEGTCVGGGACQLVSRFPDEAPIRLPDIPNERDKARLPEQPRLD